jgi:CTP-dependent riboflavin kinase
MPIFPGSLNVTLPAPFDWFAPRISKRTIWFGREEYGGERNILLVPCVLANLNAEKAMLWTPTTAARNRPDPWVVEIIAAVNLRATYALVDGDMVEILHQQGQASAQHIFLEHSSRWQGMGESARRFTSAFLVLA